MPERLRTMGERMRERIDASAILKRVQAHALGHETMTATELQAARLLLGKTMPDLRAIEVQTTQDARSPHALPLADLLRVIDGEAVHVPKAAPALAHSGSAEAGGGRVDGGVGERGRKPPLEQIISPAEQIPTEAAFRDGRATPEQREAQYRKLMANLPADPPPGYRYGELSRNGQVIKLEKIEDDGDV